MKRLSLVVLLVALGLGALWIFGGRSTGSHAVVDVAQPAASLDAPEEVELAPPGSVASVAHEPEAQRSPAPVTQVVREASSSSAAAARSNAPIAGRVVRPDGTPVPNAEVELEYAEPFRSKLGPLTLLVPGPYTLRARRDDRFFERALDVPEGTAELQLDWRLE